MRKTGYIRHQGMVSNKKVFPYYGGVFVGGSTVYVHIHVIYDLKLIYCVFCLFVLRTSTIEPQQSSPSLGESPNITTYLLEQECGYNKHWAPACCNT